MRDGAGPQSLAQMRALEMRLCNHHALEVALVAYRERHAGVDALESRYRLRRDG